jgi:hypothetical protein
VEADGGEVKKHLSTAHIILIETFRAALSQLVISPVENSDLIAHNKSMLIKPECEWSESELRRLGLV